ncbi:nuclear transport factor 2 family protein [Congregibacter sp.]|jgi:3-phenylpropionate/cinnamic acid dioxygenase small subunit|uniref:nuclear transport factor 2 family protein n=1 Tax=Congregibacter sp. TaxID=2744308 RepID=UPI0039E56FFB
MSLSTQDRVAIQEVLARAAYGYDEKALDILEACLSPDAVFSIQVQGGDVIGPFEGRDAIMGLYKQSMEQQTDQRRHVISNVFVMTDSDEPEVISNLSLIATEDGKTGLLTAGVYRDQLRRNTTGWQIVKRHLDLDNAY